MRTTPLVGSRWRHVGAHSIEGSGLLLEVVERPAGTRRGGGFYAIYPEHPKGKPVWYSRDWNSLGVYEEVST